MSNIVRAYQIYYDDQTRAKLDTMFVPLDNSANIRPDWREYWSIRKFFISQPNLEHHLFYGFLSPKFGEKAALTGTEVFHFIENYSEPVDVFAFSPFFDQTAMFLNIFEQGNAHHPGLLDCAREFLHAIGLDPSLLSHVGHSRNTIYCNYFFAKPVFWQDWFSITEALFAYCEESSTSWAKQLNAGTDHAGTSSCPLKVFLVERIASLLLATGQYRCVPYKPIDRPRTNSKASTLGDELIIADALKQTFAQTGDEQYLKAFYAHRTSTMQRLSVN